MHPAVDEAAENLTEAIDDLTRQLEEVAGDTGVMTALVDSITKAVARVSIFSCFTPVNYCQVS